MSVYYYIVNRTTKQRTKRHYGKWGDFDFESKVKYLIARHENWSDNHDIYAIGDDWCDAVKYCPQTGLTDDEMKEAFETYEKI